MTTPETEPDRREGLFRFGQNFTNKNITFRYYRDIMTRFICVNLIDEALGDGVTLVKKGKDGKKGTEPVEWFDEWQVESKKHWKEYLNSIYLERRNGQSLNAFLIHGNELFNYSFAQDDYHLKYEQRTPEIKEGYADLNILNATESIRLVIGEKKDKSDLLLEQVQEIITRRKEEVNDGLSLIEVAWDVLIAIYMLLSHSAYHTAKAGAGLKKLTIPETSLKDGASVSTIAKDANDFGSMQDTIIEISHIGDVVDKVMKVDYLDAPASGGEWMVKFDLYLIQLSILIDVPVSILKGITPGQLEGAKVNESDKFDAMEDIQDTYDENTHKYCKFIAEFLGKEEEFDVLYNARRDEIPALIESLKSFQELTGRKLTPKKASELLGLDIEEGDLEEKQEMPAMIPGQDPLIADGKDTPIKDKTKEDEDEEETEDDE